MSGFQVARRGEVNTKKQVRDAHLKNNLKAGDRTNVHNINQDSI